MVKKLDQIIYLFKEKLGIFLSISFGVFLFILFFQPFPLGNFDFNNKLVFVAGLAGIVFLILVGDQMTFFWLIKKYDQEGNEPVLPYSLRGLIMLILGCVAFAFYLNYVGSESITFYLMFKVVLICLAPPVTLWMHDEIKERSRHIESLISEIKTLKQSMEKQEENDLKKPIEFFSEKETESLKLLVTDVVFIRSADNYVEIVYKEDNHFKKKLLRNTLKNIEQQIQSNPNFIRCHRVCIVNTHYVEKLSRNFSSYYLVLKEYDEQIPVSRQYLLKLKESL